MTFHDRTALQHGASLHSSAWTLSLWLDQRVGFTIMSNSASLTGAWNLKPRYGNGRGLDTDRFRRRLDECLEHMGPFKVVIVTPRGAGLRNRRRRQSPYDRLLKISLEWAKGAGLQVDTLTIGETRKAFTGNGNASEDTMFTEAECRRYNLGYYSEVLALAAADLSMVR